MEIINFAVGALLIIAAVIVIADRVKAGHREQARRRLADRVEMVREAEATRRQVRARLAFDD